MKALTSIICIVIFFAQSKVLAFSLQTQSPLILSPILRASPATSHVSGFADSLKRRVGREHCGRIYESKSVDGEESHSIQKNGPNNEKRHEANLQRRSFLRQLSKTSTFFSLPIISTVSSIDIEPAQARGLVRFPVKEGQLLNTYHFMRAGESLLEEEGVWSTNPLFLTNREAALSPKGIAQIERQCLELKDEGVAPTIVRYSLAASAIDSANIVGRDLKVGRDRLVPEFNFMDPRAVGKWDMLPLNTTQPAVWAMDAFEAGIDGTGGRPPENEDGTPPERLADQVVRLRQLISVLETQYSGDTILLIFPDGTGPALLTSLMCGIPLNRVHELEYSPGEVRLNVGYDTASSYINKEPSSDYIETLQRGKDMLNDLRENENEIINVRDAQYAEDLRLEEERKSRIDKEAEDKRLKLKLEQEERQRKMKEREEVIKKEREEMRMQAKERRKSEMQKDDTTVDGYKVTDAESTAMIGAATIGAVLASSLLITDEPTVEDKNMTELIKPDLEVPEKEIKADSLSENYNTAFPKAVDIIIPPEDIAESSKLSINTTSPEMAAFPELSNSDEKNDISISVTSETREGPNTLATEGSKSETNKPKTSPKWDPDEDDGGLAWLNSLTEIVNEDD